MTSVAPSLPVYTAWPVLLAICLAACDPALAPADEPLAADACIGHPLATTLPTATLIAGLTRRPPQCDWNVVRVAYESNGDNPQICNIHVQDFLATLPPDIAVVPEAAEVARNTQAFSQTAQRAAIQLQVGHLSVMRGGGQFLEMIGGEKHLPIVGNLPGGDAYVISVPAVQESPSESSLLALLRNERYGLSIDCSEKITDRASAAARYAPWIGALDLEALP